MFGSVVIALLSVFSPFIVKVFGVKGFEGFLIAALLLTMQPNVMANPSDHIESFTTDSQSQNYSIRFNNNWLLKAGAVTNSYDDNGNMVDRGGDVFTYDSFNRLVGASVGNATALYTYNHLDQRVTKTLNGHTRLLLYDRSGNLISEIDAASGTVLAEYIWLDGTPLAFVQSGQTYHVHVDHLGTPKALTDTSGQVVWKAKHSPFGKATITSQGPTFNLRFPGQYFDAETGRKSEASHIEHLDKSYDP